MSGQFYIETGLPCNIFVVIKTYIMPRPKSKEELLEQSESNLTKLREFIDEMADQNITFPEATLNRNVRDILAHLYQWQCMMADWYNEGMQNKKPHMPAPGYTWKTVPELNLKIWQDFQNTSLSEIRFKLQKSHEKLTIIIEKHSDRELFEKKYYAWTGSTSLGSYLVSALSSHYDWALKLLKRVTK